MAAENRLVRLSGRLDAGKIVNRLEHAFGGRGAAHLAAPAELVPDFAVMRARLLEQADRRRGDVAHLDSRHHAPKLGDRLPIEIRAPRILWREMGLDAQRRVDARERRFVRLRKRVRAALGGVPAGRRERAGEDRGGGDGAPRNGLANAATYCDARTDPDGGDRRAGGDQDRRDQHDVELDEAVLKGCDHRRRRVAGGALPHAALHGGDEIQDPRADGDAQREDRGGGRMFADCSHDGGERDRQARVQQMADRHCRHLRRVDAAAVTFPEHDRGARGNRRGDPRDRQHQRLRGNPREGGNRMLRLDLQRAALAVAGDEANRDEREQEDGRDLARAESRRPDAGERRERLADAGGGAVEAARFGVRAHGADEGDAHQRTHREEQHPPRPRRDQLAVLLAQQPLESNRGRRRDRGETFLGVLCALCGCFPT